jgi:hypothetical protein
MTAEGNACYVLGGNAVGFARREADSLRVCIKYVFSFLEFLFI